LWRYKADLLASSIFLLFGSLETSLPFWRRLTLILQGKLCNFFFVILVNLATLFRITSLNGLLTPVWAALALVGLLWGVWARWTMGSVWRGTPEVRSDHKLITSGYEKFIPKLLINPKKPQGLFASQGIQFTLASTL